MRLYTKTRLCSLTLTYSFFLWCETIQFGFEIIAALHRSTNILMSSKRASLDRCLLSFSCLHNFSVCNKNVIFLHEAKKTAKSKACNVSPIFPQMRVQNADNKQKLRECITAIYGLFLDRCFPLRDPPTVSGKRTKTSLCIQYKSRRRSQLG